MNPMAMEYASECLYLVLMISLPPILIAVVGTIFVLGGWMSGEILRFASEIFDSFHLLR